MKNLTLIPLIPVTMAIIGYLLSKNNLYGASWMIIGSFVISIILISTIGNSDKCDCTKSEKDNN